MLAIVEDIYNRTNINILKVFPSFILGTCLCGCGGELKSIRDRCKQKLKFYLPHHHRQPKINKLNYKRVYRPDHPNADSKGCVRYHRLVMEEKLGRYLEPWEIVDHINKDRQDNRPENLRLFSNQSKHMKNHKPRTDMSDYRCSDPQCLNPEKTIINPNTGIPNWYFNKKDERVCYICWRREKRKIDRVSW